MDVNHNDKKYTLFNGLSTGWNSTQPVVISNFQYFLILHNINDFIAKLIALLCFFQPQTIRQSYGIDPVIAAVGDTLQPFYP